MPERLSSAHETTPAQPRLSADLVGDATPLTKIHWDERDTILFALGVGAGLDHPERDLAFTTENSEGVELRALPAYLNVLAASHLPPRLQAIDKTPFLHAEQALTLVRPLPTTGPGYVRASIEAVFDKGADALIVMASELFADAAALDPIGTVRCTMFVRSGGGFGGARAPVRPWSLPGRPPDQVKVYATRPEQALLFRLSGDRHPLHSDPAFARRLGFKGPILHGLCTLGFACRAAMAALGETPPTPLTALRARFARPAYPGDTLTCEMWLETPERALFRVLGPEGEVLLDRGEAALG